ncbi:MAG TPA: SRPBCC domain-containing protein [Gaiellaceae bacterium]|nr:SRPBCC domain-containing protein [Gaiellaceae bacterium]
MDDVFRALAHPARRRLLDELFRSDGLSLSELGAVLPEMTRFGVMKHLRVLEAAGLVTSRRVGRERHHFLNAVPIRQLHDRWLDRYRARAAAVLLDLKATLEEEETMSESDTQVFSVFVKAPPERVWEAITDPELTRQYYYASSVESEWEPGSPYRYVLDGGDAIVGEVLEAAPPRKLVLTFDARWDEDVTGDPPSRITWEIAEAAPGLVRLTVVHVGLVPGSATHEQVVGGMPFILSGLKTLLETGEPLAAPAATATS